MTVASVFALIQGFFAFPQEILALITLLKGTPSEQRVQIMARIKDASQKADDTQGNMDGYDDILEK